VSFEHLGVHDVPERVGGKNASLGENDAATGPTPFSVPGGFLPPRADANVISGTKWSETNVIRCALDRELDVEDVNALARTRQTDSVKWVMERAIPRGAGIQVDRMRVLQSSPTVNENLLWQVRSLLLLQKTCRCLLRRPA